MFLHSIRWRLPLSFAGIALLAALVLGVVLLTTLRGYYAVRELDHLTENARAIGDVITLLYTDDASLERIRVQMQGLSFLVQSRVRLLDMGGNALIDSGEPQQDRLITLGYGGYQTADFLDVGSENLVQYTYADSATGVEARDSTIKIVSMPVIGVVIQSEMPVEPVKIVGDGPSTDAVTLAVAGTPYGFGFNADLSLGHRSDQRVQTPVYDSQERQLGYVELSEGPAYGAEVVDGVARALVGAGLIAVTLAAGVGWLISRQISAPLLALAGVTGRMAEGQLSVRAEVGRRDEFGLLARSFNHMAGRVENTVVTLRRFVADAAHELKTPLTALRADLELAVSEADQERRAAHVEHALAQVMRLEAMTTGLLHLSRIESGTASAERTAVDLATLVWESGQLYASRAEQSGLSFRVELPGAPVLAQVNEAQVRRALGNLLDNAIKFTPEGGEVCIGVRQAGDQVEIWVNDTGIGIPPEDLPHLFSRFHRGRNAVTYPGSGLGLAIIKAIVEGHRGQVSVQTSPGHGTRFDVRLPLEAA